MKFHLRFSLIWNRCLGMNVYSIVSLFSLHGPALPPYWTKDEWLNAPFPTPPSIRTQNGSRTKRRSGHLSGRAPARRAPAARLVPDELVLEVHAYLRSLLAQLKTPRSHYSHDKKKCDFLIDFFRKCAANFCEISTKFLRNLYGLVLRG